MMDRLQSPCTNVSLFLLWSTLTWSIHHSTKKDGRKPKIVWYKVRDYFGEWHEIGFWLVNEIWSKISNGANGILWIIVSQWIQRANRTGHNLHLILTDVPVEIIDRIEAQGLRRMSPSLFLSSERRGEEMGSSPSLRDEKTEGVCDRASEKARAKKVLEQLERIKAGGNKKGG